MAILTIWSNAKLPASAVGALKTAAAGHRLILSDKIVNNLQPGIPDPLLAEADVAFGQPDAQQVIELSRLKLIQLSSAGYARYDHQDLRNALNRRGAILCNSSTVFVEPCAEHAMSFILAGARQLFPAIIEQNGTRAWSCAPLRQRSRLLQGQSLAIVGFGAIGRRLAELLAPLKMDLRGFRRAPRGDEIIPTLPISALDESLGEFDHIVNILPASAQTERLFNAARFSRMRRGAIFYNIGRGTTVEQPALRQALAAGQLAGAYLDVTVPEPLPPDDLLWSAPNCFITPHTAGGAADEFDRAVRHFQQNLADFLLGKPLRDRVF
jgi:phosphoglycerate dehydrogenase-like enzyme